MAVIETAGGPVRVVVVDDDPDVASYTATVLRRHGGCEVVALTDPAEVAGTVERTAPDVVIADYELPGTTGVELMGRLRRDRPELKVVIMTAHASVDYAVRALRHQADEFLTKPVRSADLVEVVRRLAAQSRAETGRRRSRSVLAIGAHPDDVEIGVGGLLAAHRAAGDRLSVLTLSRGARGGAADARQHESLAAAELVGARLFLEDLEDTRIPGGAPTVGAVERVVAQVRPDVVYVHSRHDRHQDHRAVHDATMVATRRVPTVGCYQSPSATVDFRPNRFVAVDDHVATKLALLRCFGTQADVRAYLEPEFVVATARYWSRFGTGAYAEPLEIVRDTGDLVPTDLASADPRATTSEGRA